MKKNIPNFITTGNLLCGLLGVLFWKEDALFYAALMILAGAIFDFFDGFTARTIGVSSPIGRDLDSFADMVTFGVLPGLITFSMIGHWNEVLAYTALFIPVFSAWRLAKFNNDPRQSDLFIGLPTPANAMFFGSLALVENGLTPAWAGWLLEPGVLAVMSVLFSILLISELRLFSLKFKNWKFKGNETRYLFLLCSVLLLAMFKILAIPMIILGYIILSFALQRNLNNEIQS